jgi:O-antigen ligase
MVQLSTRSNLSAGESNLAGVLQMRPSIAGRVAAGVLYAALALPPFLFGSREPTTVAAWCALLGAGLVVAPLRRLEYGHWIVIAAIAFVALCFGVVLHEQLSDHPWIAPFNPIWEKASDALGKQLVPSVSVVRGEPFFALGHPLANLLALVLGIVVGVDSDRARRGVRVMAWAGVGYAVYGILALAFDPTEILWREKTDYFGNLTGTFINRNTAAAYFGSCSVVWLVLLMGSIRRNLPPGPIEWRRVPQRLLRRTRKDALVRFVVFFACLSALFMTSSRGGVLVSLGVMVLTFVIYFRRDMPRGPKLVLVVITCMAVSFLLLQILGGNVSSRLDLQGLSDGGRLSVYRATLRMIADNPWFGTGLGTFASAFPAYRSFDGSMWGVWGIGHNTPLEFASEMGLPLTAIVAMAWAAALVVLLRTSLRGRTGATTSLPAVSVALIALLHSSIDFSLQVAGYSIVVFALLGLGLSQAVRVSSSSRG